MAFFEGIVRFHYSGSFVGEGESLRYENGIVDELGIDPDKLSKIELEELLKDAGCKNVLHIYYKRPGLSMCRGLKLIESDFDVLDMAGELVERGEVDTYAVHKVDDPHDAVLELEYGEVIEGGNEAHVDAVNDVGLDDVNDAGLDVATDAGKEGGLENEELGTGEVGIGVENVNLGAADGEKQNGPLPNVDGLGGQDGDRNAQDAAEIHVQEFSNGCAYFVPVEDDNSEDEDPEVKFARSEFETVIDEMLDEFEKSGFSLPGFRPIDAAEYVSGFENEADPSNNFNPEEPYYSTDEDNSVGFREIWVRCGTKHGPNQLQIKGQAFGNVQGGSASTCNTPTPNWFETVSSASTGGLQQASTNNKRPREPRGMEGYGLYTNHKGWKLRMLVLLLRGCIKLSTRKASHHQKFMEPKNQTIPV
ncbi:hypothetical protein COLO4_22892 [Corchorus olitorius]|uniref:PB1-like domain-containing protein n=1 Tax=Corchorus olitorius TaxID=93759 RepID=A0A1R3IJ77_9ROSI|nr:hypothetical protein COLO4_22892 [Corchorus olitorius]